MADHEPMTIHVPQKREYVEVTLHFKGGTSVVAAVKEIETKNNSYGQFTGIRWTHTEWDDLPRIDSIALAKLQAITTKVVRTNA